jgi:5-methyltetrahydrofolate--homocysteine methyltransferase
VTGEQLTGPLDVAEIARWINPQMLYGKHLGLRGSYRKRKDAGDPQVAELEAVVKRVFDEGWISVQGVWRFLEARSDGNRLEVSDVGRVLGSWTFPRQRAGDHLCLADFVAPAGATPDSVALFVVTAGAGVRARAERLKADGEYLLCHALQAVAVECAEAAAEWLHARLRAAWGFADPPETTMMDRFQARYRGKRFSFGYPACPDLSGQKLLFDLLRPERIGVELTDGFMMDPEASVSAVVVHHPAAHYFGA